MVEYISREAAIDATRKVSVGLINPTKGAWDLGFTNALHLACNSISAIPAADVVPVVRGKWDAVKGALHPAETSAVCSNCGFATMIHAQTFYNFCPNCGADMREES